MDTNNPCTYSYIESDDLSSLYLSDEWIEARKIERGQNMERFAKKFNDENHRLYVFNNNIDYYLEAMKYNNLGQMYYRRASLEDTQATAEYCHSQIIDICHTTLPKAFDAIDKHQDGIDTFFMVLLNEDSKYRAEKHFHTRNPLDRSKDRRAVTVVIPYKIVEPVNEYVKFQYVDSTIDKKSGLDINLVRDNILRTEEDPELPIQSIKMPDVGQYLVIDFNSTKCLHWVENNGSKNEYICLITES